VVHHIMFSSVPLMTDMTGRTEGRSSRAKYLILDGGSYIQICIKTGVPVVTEFVNK
jgi:hypothetical protein